MVEVELSYAQRSPTTHNSRNYCLQKTISIKSTLPFLHRCLLLNEKTSLLLVTSARGNRSLKMNTFKPEILRNQIRFDS